MDILIWLGIIFCISQSAMFSGLNLAYFSISRLRLEVEKNQGNQAATKVLKMREDSNFLLTTILWGNVGINVLLTLLSNQVLLGISAFLFSTIFITVIGEIVPQAYFSRHALDMASRLQPAMKFYQILLYPFSKPTALMLDSWLGAEGIHFYKEHEIRDLINIHVKDTDSEIDHVEGMGVLNFLNFDDMPVTEEGEDIDPGSIIALPLQEGKLIFPEFRKDPEDPFLKSIQKSGKKWVMFTDEDDNPYYALDADSFLRDVLFSTAPKSILSFCHKPIIVKDPKTSFNNVITRFKVSPQRIGDDVIDEDLILLWSNRKKIITGADILGRLLRGIAKHHPIGHRT